MHAFALLSIIIGIVSSSSTPQKDAFAECAEWAERGDCSTNGRPYFMQKNCPEACYKKTHREPDVRRMNEDQTEEFYELTAKTANGKTLSMENLEGYVTVIVNSARVCDYSEIFWQTLEHLHSINPYALEILAFPFDHPGSPIDKCRESVLAAEKEKGHKIHIMEAIDINGPNTHPIYQYMKNLFDIEEMDPNFAHYFFINPDGNYVELHYGASWQNLKQFVDTHVKHDYADREF